MPGIEINKALAIDGWMRPIELLFLAIEASRRAKICEIGSWKGRSTRALLDNTQGQVTAVDTWKGTPGDAGHENVVPEELFKTFKDNLRDIPFPKLRVYEGTSLEAAELFQRDKEQFDMVFIDGDHHYASVKADIQAWKGLVSPGGILCGHDYAPEWVGVRQAVDEIFPSWIYRYDSIWVVNL